jgi:hypothetical protein
MSEVPATMRLVLACLCLVASATREPSDQPLGSSLVGTEELDAVVAALEHIGQTQAETRIDPGPVRQLLHRVKP